MIKMILGLILAAGIAAPSDVLTITQEKKPVADVTRSEITTLFPGMPVLDVEKYNRFTYKLNKMISRSPQNAFINPQGGITPEKPGHQLNRRAFKERFYRYFFGHDPMTFEAPLQTVYPRVDSELLADIRVQSIGSYVTHFNPNNKSRAHNIVLAAEAIDNHVLFPDEIFSFNQTVGMRTKTKGYLPAPIIVRGEYSEGIGGGICQVSSTLFNAADRAGLRIVQRYSHSKRVAYVPPGRDATVSWYGPDLRFKNIYNQPILIRARKYGGSIAFTLYSSEVINVKQRKVPDTSTKIPEEKRINRLPDDQ